MFKLLIDYEFIRCSITYNLVYSENLALNTEHIVYRNYYFVNRISNIVNRT